MNKQQKKAAFIARNTCLELIDIMEEKDRHRGNMTLTARQDIMTEALRIEKELGLYKKP